MGLDIAAVNSGMCIIEARCLSEYPWIEIVDTYEEWHYSDLGSFQDRMRVSSRISEFQTDDYNVDLVVLEDYAKRMGKTNTSAYEHAELCSLIKAFTIASGKPMLIIPPTTMRSFMAIPNGLKDKGKQMIIDNVKEIYGFESKAPRKNQRSNITDAFVHAVIGALVIYGINGILVEEELDDQAKKLLFGKGKTTGILDRPQFQYNFPEKEEEENGTEEHGT